MSQYKVWQDRYETGWQYDDGTLDNSANYFSKKWDAMRFVMRQVEQDQQSSKTCIFSGYVYDRTLAFTRWYHKGMWTRKQPEFPFQRSGLHTGAEEYVE